MEVTPGSPDSNEDVSSGDKFHSRLAQQVPFLVRLVQAGLEATQTLSAMSAQPKSMVIQRKAIAMASRGDEDSESSWSENLPER